jgi:hypothetical protein
MFSEKQSMPCTELTDKTVFLKVCFPLNYVNTLFPTVWKYQLSSPQTLSPRVSVIMLYYFGVAQHHICSIHTGATACNSDSDKEQFALSIYIPTSYACIWYYFYSFQTLVTKFFTVFLLMFKWNAWNKLGIKFFFLFALWKMRLHSGVNHFSSVGVPIFCGLSNKQACPAISVSHVLPCVWHLF